MLTIYLNVTNNKLMNWATLTCWQPKANLFLNGVFFEKGGLSHLAKMVVSVLHKELECKVEKLKYKKLEFMQPRIKNKSELPTHE